MNNTSSTPGTSNDNSAFWSAIAKVPAAVSAELDQMFGHRQEDEFVPSCPVAREAGELSAHLLAWDDQFACARIDSDSYNGVPIAHIRCHALTRIQEGLFALQQLERYLAIRGQTFAIAASEQVPAEVIPAEAEDIAG